MLGCSQGTALVHVYRWNNLFLWATVILKGLHLRSTVKPGQLLTFFGFLQFVLGTFFCLQKLLDSLRLAGHAGCWGWWTSVETGAQRECYAAARLLLVVFVLCVIATSFQIVPTQLAVPGLLLGTQAWEWSRKNTAVRLKGMFSSPQGHRELEVSD